MATYRITAPDGNSYNVTAPDTASQDEVLAYAKANYQKAGGGRNWMNTIGTAAKESFTRPLAAAKDLGTNPQTMANAMPGLLGIAGGISPIPGGATMGTAVGQGLRDASLYAMKKPIPGPWQHAGELGGAALGDILAIPAMKRSRFGGQIGEAEKTAGVVTRAPMKAVTPGSVGQTLNDLEAQIDAGTINTPQAAKDAKAVISQVYKNPKIYEQTGEISVQAQRVSKKVQDLLNQMVPGRAGPAQALARSQMIPNSISRGYQAIPKPVRTIAGIGAAGGVGAASWDLIRKMLGL